MQSIKLVKEFQAAFSNPVSVDPTPHIPGSVLQYGCDVINNEVNNLWDAADSGTIADFANALGNIQYMLDGLFLVAGLENKKDDIIEEIHRSNMSKLCTTEEEAQNTIDQIKNNTNNTFASQMEYYYAKENEYWKVYRSVDNELVNSMNYAKPNINKIINNTKDFLSQFDAIREKSLRLSKKVHEDFIDFLKIKK